VNAFKPAMIAFDFDGVIADSETLANQALADRLTKLGYSTTLESAFDNYLGRHWGDCLTTFERLWGRPAPAELRRDLDADIERKLPDLRPVPGAAAFIECVSDRPRCIASSSTPDWIRCRLELFGFADHFADKVFSAAVHVSRGKPHPDIYLHAAKSMGVDPHTMLVIEDSPSGVSAAAAAGARVVGLCAASHIRPGHGERLSAAGAHHICQSFDEVFGLIT
jgi:HAD superfamily hydrolase (TIGR01509 family)